MGEVLPAGDRRVLEAFAAQAAVVLDRERLRQQASEARQLEQGNPSERAARGRIPRLRTPLASIRAAVGSLRQTDVKWSAEDEAELLATVDIRDERLERLIDNLLDLSSQAGAVRPLPIPSASTRSSAGGGGCSTRSRVGSMSRGLPLVTPIKLLERVIANVIENALRYGPPELQWS